MPHPYAFLNFENSDLLIHVTNFKNQLLDASLELRGVGNNKAVGGQFFVYLFRCRLHIY